jgi:hypothetical protein
VVRRANAVTNATGYACTTPDPANAMICVYDEAGKVIKTYEYNGDFKEW